MFRRGGGGGRVGKGGLITGLKRGEGCEGWRMAGGGGGCGINSSY